MGVLLERKIQISNLPEGHSIDGFAVKQVIESHYDKIASHFLGDLFLDVHFKELKKAGKKEELDIRVNAKVNGKKFHASSMGWHAEKVLREALMAVEKEIAKAKAKKTSIR